MREIRTRACDNSHITVHAASSKTRRGPSARVCAMLYGYFMMPPVVSTLGVWDTVSHKITPITGDNKQTLLLGLAASSQFYWKLHGECSEPPSQRLAARRL